MAASDVGAITELVTRCRPPGVDVSQQLHLGHHESTPSKLLPGPARASRICPANLSHLLCFCYICLLLFLKVTKPRSFAPAVPTVHHGLSLVLCSVSQCTIQTLLSVSPSGEGGLSRQASPLTPVPSSHLPSAPSTNHDLKSMGSNLSSAVLLAR